MALLLAPACFDKPPRPLGDGPSPDADTGINVAFVTSNADIMLGTAWCESKFVSAKAERLESAVLAKLSRLINVELPFTWLAAVARASAVNSSSTMGSATPIPPEVGS